METRTFELEFAKFIQRFLSHYQLGRTMLEDVAESSVQEFTKNVDKKTSVEDIADKYVRLGVRCCEERISFSEMVRAFILLKRHIWLFFQESNFAGQPFDVRSIVALNNRTALFFDRAIYYFLVGYEQAESDEKTELETFYRSFLDRIRRDLGIGNEPQE